MRQRIALSVLLVFCLMLGFQRAQAQERIAGDILLMLTHGSNIETTLKQTQGRYADAAIELGETVAPTLNIWLVKSNPAWEHQVLNYLRSLPQVQIAQFNRIAEERLTPNDTLYPQQWHLENTGQSSGIPGADIKAHLAWDIATGGLTVAGDTIVVAVVDRGFELSHTDLRFWHNPHEIDGDGIDNDGNGYIDDVYGWNTAQQNDFIPNNAHGTMCAGIIGASSNNSIGTAGVNWGLPILPVVCSQYSESQVVAAYAYILETRRLYNQTNGAKGAFIVATNSSFGVDFGQTADFPIWCAMYDSLGKQGIMSAGATANIGHDVDNVGDIPSNCNSDFLMVVTNTTRTDYKNPGAGYGNTSVDLGAPGTTIWSTTMGSGHSASTGTSYATPQVAGAVALLISTGDSAFIQAYKQYPDSILREVKRVILQSVDILPDLASTTASGGRLNLFKALMRFQNDFCSTCFLINSVVQDAACYQDSSGSISVIINNGRSPYSYAWSNGDTTATAQNLPAGNYTVTVTDSLGDTRLAYFTIAQPVPLQTGYIVQRSTGNDGSIKVQVLGGTPPYQYTWANNVGLGDTALNLAPGIYTVTVTDQNGCAKADTINVYLDSTVNNTPTLSVIQSISLFPNPTTGRLYFEIEAAAQGMLEMELVDLLGRRVQQYSQTASSNLISGSMDMEALPSGMYLLNVRFGSAEMQVIKVFKQ